MEINFLVHDGITASDAINLIARSHAGLTSFATHLPCYRDQFLLHTRTSNNIWNIVNQDFHQVLFDQLSPLVSTNCAWIKLNDGSTLRSSDVL